MKKILITIPDLCLGGVTTSLLNFCNELLNRGWDVHVLNMSSSKDGEFNSTEERIKFLKLHGISKYWKLGMQDVRCARGIIKKITLFALGIIKKVTNKNECWMRIIFRNYFVKERYDVAVAFKQSGPCYYFVLNCVNANKKVAFIHGDINYMGDISSWDYFLPVFYSIACVSNAVGRGFVERYPQLCNKIKTVYNMFDVNFIKKQSKVGCLQHVLEEQGCCIVTVARIENATKHIDIIPQICKRLKEITSRKFHWYIIGDGPEYQVDNELSESLKTTDVLTFCGAMDNPYCVMNKADFIVLTSRTEAYSMVVIESLILGKPIVVTRYPGVEEAINNGFNGLIVEQDIDDITEKILSCIEDREGILTLMRENLRTRNISNDNAYTQFLDCIR